MRIASFFRRGWVRFPHDPEIADWAARVRPVAAACLERAEYRERWLRCGGTWFIGANVLPNDTDGAIVEAGVPPLAGAPVRFIWDALGLENVEWDKGQVSVCFPGYPQPSPDESAAAFRFRTERDGAHVDGIRRCEGRRRRLGEAHGFILGLPLTDSPPDAAPFVVWEGSHEIIRRALRERLRGVPASRWGDEDVTDTYTAARRECFERCRRITLNAHPGEAYVVHRLALHGIAPWRAEETGKRAVVYFRPNPFPAAARDWWLERP